MKMGQHKQQQADEKDDFYDAIQEAVFVNWGGVYQWLNVYAHEVCLSGKKMEERFTCIASVPISKGINSLYELYKDKATHTSAGALHNLVLDLGQFTEILKEKGKKHNVEIVTELEDFPGESYGAVIE
jgi:hypothetical protein